MHDCEVMRLDFGGKHPRVDCFTKIMKHYPGRKTLLDIGAGHCHFSIAAAKLGLQVTAVDVRAERVPNNLSHFGINFVLADVNSQDFQVGNVDIVLLLGILYHLTLKEQKALLMKCRTRLTMIDTHYTNTPRVSEDGYEGIYYIEDEAIRQDPRSAWTSSHSFWHTQSSLLRLFRACGYNRIIKVEPEADPKVLRSFYVCETSPSSRSEFPQRLTT